MSVVNKMLQDLENRDESSVKNSANYQQPAKGSARGKLLLIGLLAVCAIALGGYFVLNANTPQPTQNTGIVPLNQQSAQPRAVTASQQTANQQAEATITAPTMTVRPDSALPDKAGADSTLPGNLQQSDQSNQQPASEPAATTSAPEAAQSSGSWQQTHGDTAAASGLKPAASTHFSVTRKQPVATRADGLRAKIGAALERDDTPSAIQLLRELIVVEKTNPRPAKKLASLYYAQGQMLKAQALLDKQIGLHPNDSSLRLMSARLLTKQNEPQQALERLYTLPVSTAMEIDFLSYRAALAQELGELDKALSDYHLLITQDSRNARWWLGLGIVADQQSNPSVAFQAYEQALTLAQLEPAVERYITSRLASLKGMSNE